MRRTVAILVVMLVLVGAAFWWLTRPVAPSLVSMPQGDPQRGETVFWAAGCSSCHAADKASGDDKLLLSGGHRLATGFGTFVAPNISPDPVDGIGGWSDMQFYRALTAGVSPDGRHYYPAFPYASYAGMRIGDVADLWAFMKTLPPISGKAPPSELGFPFNVRRGVGLWKLANLSSDPPTGLSGDGLPAVQRGAYLVEVLGHCGECHTPRNLTQGLDTARWLAGGPAPQGDGRIPAIHSGALDWSAADIAYYLESGFTPEFDSVGGSMVAVQENMARLSAEDRQAIAAYLKKVPAPPAD